MKVSKYNLKGIKMLIFTQVAKSCRKQLTRVCLIKQSKNFSLSLENVNLNVLKQVTITFSKNNHQGLSKVYSSFLNI